MKPVHIEFCRQGETGRSSLPLWVLLGVGLGLTLLGLAVGSGFAEKAEARSSQASQLQDERTSLNDAARAQERVPADVVDSVNSAIRMLDYPSIELLTQLERHARPDVTVVGIEMGAVRTTLRVIVQASSAPAVLDYVDAIKQESGFRSVALTRQEGANGGDGSGGWRFTLEVPQIDAVPRASARMPRGQE